MATLPPDNRQIALFSNSRTNPHWLALYRKILAVIAIYGLVVFTTLDGPLEVWFEASFFLIVFPVLIWPLLLRD